MTERDGDGSPWGRLHVDAASGVPIWVQVKTQLEYVIATGAVPTGTRLPSVRSLSKEYGIAVDTVRQAYEELGKTGLVHTQHGVGTFTTLPEDDGNDVTSPDMSWAHADAALGELIRTGTDPREAARAMAQRVALLRHGIDIVFVGVAASIERYAQLISAQLPTELGAVRPVAIEDLRARDTSTIDTATYALSLVFHAREVENLLGERPIRVLSVMSRLEDGLLNDVAAASQECRPVLITRPETRPIYAELLRSQRPDLTDLPFANDADDDAIAAALGQTDVVLHTSAAADVVHRLAGPHHRQIELRHIPQEKSLDHVVQTLKSDRELRLDLQRQHINAH